MRYNCLSFNRNLTLGASALTCYLHACRHQSEPKSRKYLARTIWMLTYDDEKVLVYCHYVKVIVVVLITTS